MMSTYEKWDRRFLEMAKMVASWSKDPSTKCGAVIVRPDRTVASVGFNGFPRGCNDAEDLYNNRETKYARVVHAELNAILSCRENMKGYTIYTWPPHVGPACDRCSVAIIQAGIARIVHQKVETNNDRWSSAIKTGLGMFREAGVMVISVSPEAEASDPLTNLKKKNAGQAKGKPLHGKKWR